MQFRRREVLTHFPRPKKLFGPLHETEPRSGILAQTTREQADSWLLTLWTLTWTTTGASMLPSATLPIRKNSFLPAPQWNGTEPWQWRGPYWLPNEWRWIHRTFFSFPKNKQEIKRTLFNWTKQDKTCKFSRKSSFSSYVQHKNRRKKKRLIQLILCQLDVAGWQKEQGTGLTLLLGSSYPPPFLRQYTWLLTTNHSDISSFKHPQNQNSMDIILLQLRAPVVCVSPCFESWDRDVISIYAYISDDKIMYLAPDPPTSPSLISLMVPVNVKHHVSCIMLYF